MAKKVKSVARQAGRKTPKKSAKNSAPKNAAPKKAASTGVAKVPTEQVSFRIPKAWLPIVDATAKASPVAVKRAAVLRAAVQKGLAAMSGQPVE